MLKALITVGRHGQIVILKKVRQSAGIQGVEKLVVYILQNEGDSCYLLLAKAGNSVKIMEHSRTQVVMDKSGS